ncbi:hypothetical protein QOZ84_08715 [Romboutsia sedimentorum]|uniref:Uncharacterized protein n=1 Tax=Romboutsia sedimentorum TaxID=1368474 RepID=A0ABT7ECH1_9FIRM|nr:hypothetical protein [Romboutsia sedimentorum]MDK2563631.1 hypothetical protein [Romboutsia sedimentorum]
MNLNYGLIVIVMLFVILMSIQFTLNKIYVILKEIKEIINLRKIKD